MKKELSFVIKNFLYFIFTGVICTLVLGCIFLDLHYFKYVPERGFVEHTQELLIFLSASIFLYLAFKRKKKLQESLLPAASMESLQ